MLKIFNYLHIQQNQTEKEKNIVRYIAKSIIHLFKSDTPPSSYKSVLNHIKNLSSSPSPSSEYNFPLAARCSLNK
jgi:hypothetical protein